MAIVKITTKLGPKAAAIFAAFKAGREVYVKTVHDLRSKTGEKLYVFKTSIHVGVEIPDSEEDQRR